MGTYDEGSTNANGAPENMTSPTPPAREKTDHICGTPDAMCDTNCMRASNEWPMCEADCDRMERAAIAVEDLTEQRNLLFVALEDARDALAKCGWYTASAKCDAALRAARGDGK